MPIDPLGGAPPATTNDGPVSHISTIEQNRTMQKLREQCVCQQERRPCAYHEGVEDAYNRILTILERKMSAQESNKRMRAFLREQITLDYMKERP
jgi:hypothetical protein